MNRRPSFSERRSQKKLLGISPLNKVNSPSQPHEWRQWSLVTGVFRPKRSAVPYWCRFFTVVWWDGSIEQFMREIAHDLASNNICSSRTCNLSGQRIQEVKKQVSGFRHKYAAKDLKQWALTRAFLLH
jgi:hypothetical protein